MLCKWKLKFSAKIKLWMLLSVDVCMSSNFPKRLKRALSVGRIELSLIISMIRVLVSETWNFVCDFVFLLLMNQFFSHILLFFFFNMLINMCVKTWIDIKNCCWWNSNEFYFVGERPSCTSWVSRIPANNLITLFILILIIIIVIIVIRFGVNFCPYYQRSQLSSPQSSSSWRKQYDICKNKQLKKTYI